MESLVGTFVLDMSLYRRALTAPSAVPDSITASYERLEYLGDGILEGIIRQFIYSRYTTLTLGIHALIWAQGTYTFQQWRASGQVF